MAARRLTLYPAIDLKGGACVRLQRGDMDAATIYSDDPAAQARAWIDRGCTWLHVVDLDGAFAGRAVNAEAVEAILAAATASAVASADAVASGSVPIRVQLGGGIRDRAGIARWLDAGVSRVILGSAAAKNPALVREACAAHPGRIAVGIDARDGFVATEGWAEHSDMQALDLARRFEDVGVSVIVFTDIGRDGMLAGLAIERTLDIAASVSTPVIASGGVGSTADLVALRDAAEQAGVALDGVIVGRALYDGRVEPREAIAVLSG